MRQSIAAGLGRCRIAIPGSTSGSLRSLRWPTLGQSLVTLTRRRHVSHALIIDDNMVISRAIERRLGPFGFDSFDRACAGHQTVKAAGRHAPDLIVVGDTIADGSPIEFARRIAMSCDAPVLLVTSGRVQLERRVLTGTRVDGPFHVTQLDAALASTGARKVELCA